MPTDIIYEEIKSIALWQGYLEQLKKYLNKTYEVYFKSSSPATHLVTEGDSGNLMPASQPQVNLHQMSNAVNARTVAKKTPVEHSKLAADLRFYYENYEEYDTTQFDVQRVWSHQIKSLRERTYVFLHLIKGRIFRDWIHLPSSQKLLIIDDMDRTQDTEVISMLCLLIFQAGMRVRDPGTGIKPVYLPLIFFCNRHTRKFGKEPGAIIMLKSLIAQLLAGYHDFDVKGLVPIITKKEGETNIAAALGRLFEFLILQLPREVFVLCIIHEVRYYEKQEKERDINDDSFLSALLLMTNDIQRNKLLKAKFKVLITSTSQKTVKSLESEGNPLSLLKMTSVFEEIKASRVPRG